METESRKSKRYVKIVVIISAIIALELFLLLLFLFIIPFAKYNRGVSLYNERKYDEAIVVFKSLDGYKDSEEQITKCEAAIVDSKYDTAVDLFESGKYEEAIIAFETLNGYRDSNEQITKCKTAIKDAEYNAAVELYESGKYDEAISAFEALNGYRDSNNMIVKCRNEQKYQYAVQLQSEGKYSDAISAFFEIMDYKDSKDKLAECRYSYQLNQLKNVSKGSTIKFGYYEQDNNNDNGYEEIEWIVLAIENNKALVISKYVLDCQQFTSTNHNTTWGDCRLRYWLNEFFLNDAFTMNHQKHIIESYISADKNISFSTDSGVDTKDKIFCISAVEATNFFSSNEERSCLPTTYAKKKGANSLISKGTCNWWLRTIGSTQNAAVIVDNYGNIYYSGYLVSNLNVGVRPAMWIKIDS